MTNVKSEVVAAVEEAELEKAVKEAAEHAGEPGIPPIDTTTKTIEATIFGVAVTYSSETFTSLLFLDDQVTANDPESSDEEKMIASMRMVRTILGAQTRKVLAAAGDVQNFPEIARQLMEAVNPN